eukprot:scaffold166408_cov36-Prasinocladus_malaysianus.AAC.2
MTWKTFAYHDVVVATLASHQEDLLLRFRDLVVSNFVSKGASMFRLSLEPLEFFNDTDTLIQWATMDNNISQLMLIDSSGMESVRIDADLSPDGSSYIWTVTPDALLQDKSSSYYSVAALDLQPASIFVSPVDLNVENGSVEIPFTPVYRIASPVFEAGERFGF